MGEFVEGVLGDVIELKRGYDLPRQDRIAGTIPIVSSSGITGHHSTPMVKGPGVVTGRYGTLGEVYFVAEDFWPLNTTLYVRDFKKNDPRFISYFLRSLDFYAYSDKAAVPGLNRNHLHTAPVKYPVDLEEQRTIASTLGGLDDKIDLNRRTNETLEVMARAIFKDWFVDFGPTRAKMEGRAPYLSPDIWALFPGRLDGEGKPEGWKWALLGQHAAITKGKSYKSEELQEAQSALVTLKSFARGGGYRRDGLKSFSGECKPDQVVQEGEIVVAQTDVTQAADVIGRPARVISDARFERLIASLDVAVIRPLASTYLDNEFLLRLMGTEKFTQHTFAHTSGTTVLHLGKNAIPSFEFILPSARLVEAYFEIASPLAARQIRAVHEIDTLATARDLLLPKLMSGEIRVMDAETSVSEAS